MIYILFLAGFVLLVKGATRLVDGASGLALRRKVSPMLIGMTLVALGTSIPELVVNVVSAFHGVTDLAIGTVVGSNITNILLILGVTSIVAPLVVTRQTKIIDIPLALIIVVGLRLLASDFLLSRSDGGILILFLIIFLYYIISTGRSEEVASSVKILPWRKIILYVVAGSVLLILGGKRVVYGAVALSQYMGISERVIGLTVIALGTSLPELVTSVVATLKGRSNIAIGNIIGSNVLNIVLVLAATILVNPIRLTRSSLIDILLCVAITLLLFLPFMSGKKELLSRSRGVVFVVLYIGYILYTLGIL